jgi:hypothetical protein
MRQMLREIDGVLTCAAADFQYLPALCESDAQDAQYGIFVTFACFGKRQHDSLYANTATLATVSLRKIGQAGESDDDFYVRY